MSVGTDDRANRTASRSAGRHRRPTRLSHAVARAVGVAVCCTAGVASGAGLAPVVVSGQWSPLGDGAQAGPVTPAAETSPTRVERLIAEHGCWTGAAPDAAIPSRAVVTLPGGRAQVTAGDVGFALWLGPDDAPGTGDERAGQLHAFCR